MLETYEYVQRQRVGRSSAVGQSVTAGEGGGPSFFRVINPKARNEFV